VRRLAGAIEHVAEEAAVILSSLVGDAGCSCEVGQQAMREEAVGRRCVAQDVPGMAGRCARRCVARAGSADIGHAGLPGCALPARVHVVDVLSRHAQRMGSAKRGLVRRGRPDTRRGVAACKKRLKRGFVEHPARAGLHEGMPEHIKGAIGVLRRRPLGARHVWGAAAWQRETGLQPWMEPRG